jgi:hypothetical protein
LCPFEKNEKFIKNYNIKDCFPHYEIKKVFYEKVFMFFILKGLSCMKRI